MRIKICFEYYKNDGEVEFLNSHSVKHIDGVKIIDVEINAQEGDSTTNAMKDIVVEFAKDYIKAIFDEPEYIKNNYPTIYKKSMTCQYWFHIFEEDFIKISQKEFEAESFDEPREFDEIIKDDGENETPVFKIDMIDVILDKDLNVIDCQPEPINYWDTIL